MSRFDAGLLERARRWVEQARAAELAPPVLAPSDPTSAAIEVAATLARRFEGLYLKPYLCPAGKPTIGYGATFYNTGRVVTLSDPPISKEYAEALLQWMLRTVYLPAVRRQCPDVDDPNRLGALLDFTLNLGEGNLRASTLRRRINEGRWEDVPAELSRWKFGGGRVQKGLVLRRAAEAALV